MQEARGNSPSFQFTTDKCDSADDNREYPVIFG